MPPEGGTPTAALSGPFDRRSDSDVCVCSKLSKNFGLTQVPLSSRTSARPEEVHPAVWARDRERCSRHIRAQRPSFACGHFRVSVQMISSRKSRPPGSERKGSLGKGLGREICRKVGGLEKIFLAHCRRRGKGRAAAMGWPWPLMAGAAIPLGSNGFGRIGSGGVASLDHRLMASTPAGVV
jgi:hypothetical protein